VSSARFNISFCTRPAPLLMMYSIDASFLPSSLPTIGLDPNPDKLKKVATGMESAVDQWETLLARLRLSKDFQTREYAKLTQAHLQTHGASVESIRDMMRWQARCLRALAENTPPPMPPPTLDLQALIQQAQDESNKPPPTIRGLQELQGQSQRILLIPLPHLVNPR
jgi:hypothetical protein